MKLVFASNNAHKLDEVRAIMPAGVDVLSLNDVGFKSEIEENGATLADNSAIKAHTVAKWLTAHPYAEPVDGVFADDTGLEIDALGGKPGVYTARWAGEPAANRKKALAELQNKTDRGAQFKTVITLIKNGKATQVEGIVRGQIASEEYGKGGFGYDPIFIPEGYEKTFGELPAEIKNSISHRARALANLVKLLFFALCLLCINPLMAQKWTTHLAYNNITQIATAPELVYAISDGSLYSVNKQSEQIKVYDRQTGLHGTGITCIHYDEAGKQLIIGYETGAIDILHNKGVEYVGELRDKDMTQRKTINNVTIYGRTAYLSTAFGVQTMDLRENKLVDSYWLRPSGQETDVVDVVIANDSIYAFTSDSMFCAAVLDNLVDYTNWQREQRSGRISPDPNKGTQYEDNNSTWYAGGSDGIVRFTATERITYKPEGPINNKPYRLTVIDDHVWMVNGGRWAVQYDNPGHFMHYDGTHWTNTWVQSTQERAGGWVLDFMNVAVDPKDKSHCFVTSYGTGLYEFRGDSAVNKWIGDGTTPITAAATNDPARYTRLAYATYDKEGNLWFFNAGGTAIRYQLICIDPDGIWHGLRVTNGSAAVTVTTPTGLIIDALQPNYKWIARGRDGAFICLLDDGGTRLDSIDDRTVVMYQWTDQHGNTFRPDMIIDIFQDNKGRIWMGTDNGVAYIEAETDCFSSDAIIRPNLLDTDGQTPLLEGQVQAFSQTSNGDIWIGTLNQGVYVLNSEATEIKAHYGTDNTALPSNSILSLACNEKGVVWIGTADGLVSFDPNSSPEGLSGKEENYEYEMGTMLQWKQHLSYSSATNLTPTPNRIFAIANNSLLSYNRADGTLEYWNRSNGLNGSTVACIAYDTSSKNLIVAYDDGRIDLINDDGTIKQMPDIYLKAGSIAVTPNDICIGNRYCYLAMPFGIIAIDTRKTEVKSTYYIGDESANVDVKFLLEKNDTLYAFADDKLYRASLMDNLEDYHFWSSEDATYRSLQYVAVYQDSIFALQHDSLYVYNGATWQLIRPEACNWVRASGGHIFVCTEEVKLHSLTEDHQLHLLCDRYAINDAIYTQGEYWVGERYWGFIRLSTDGDEYYHPEGPNSNFCYSMVAAHGQIYSVIGGRWATEWVRYARMNIYNGGYWHGYNEAHLIAAFHKLFLDPVSIAVDPRDKGHYFVATYGTGLLEFRNDAPYTYYDAHNSTLREATTGINPEFYTRTDGAMMDEQGNLWVMNRTSLAAPLHILTSNGVWHPIDMYTGGEKLIFSTPTGIWSDKRDSQRKWMMDQRNTQGLVLLDDGGTPTDNSDDRCVKRTSFIDQDEKAVTPEQFRCWAQDKTNRIWIGTEKGLFTIPEKVDFFTSNACRRIIIPRNDGTNLGDYLLGEEQINCMAVDGGNRMWIGTATSGLYIIEDDTITAAHFTENNSLLPSNTITAIVIEPTTGEVFVGTDKGVASYRSDASEPQTDMSSAYAFPNPVRPNYDGIISIAGLMENTMVNIIDAGGNLVCKTRSHGGTAVWDGKLADGRRATAGVYTALCNEPNGGHTVVKILVVR